MLNNIMQLNESIQTHMEEFAFEIHKTIPQPQQPHPGTVAMIYEVNAMSHDIKILTARIVVASKQFLRYDDKLEFYAMEIHADD